MNYFSRKTNVCISVIVVGQEDFIHGSGVPGSIKVVVISTTIKVTFVQVVT